MMVNWTQVTITCTAPATASRRMPSTLAGLPVNGRHLHQDDGANVIGGTSSADDVAEGAGDVPGTINDADGGEGGNDPLDYSGNGDADLGTVHDVIDGIL
eukprot:jgi/Ulvmu1/12462/UM009_0114.1